MNQVSQEHRVGAKAIVGGKGQAKRQWEKQGLGKQEPKEYSHVT